MPLISPAGLTFHQWRREMWLAHDGPVDVSRARFDALTRPSSLAEIERDMMAALNAVAFIKNDIREAEELLAVALRDNLLTPPSSLSPGGEPWAPIHQRYIEERTELLQRHERRIASYRAQIDAIEAKDPRGAVLIALRDSAAHDEDVAEIASRRPLAAE